MAKLAFLFPGQGSQYVGMGKELHDNYPLSRQAFELSDSRLGDKLSEIIFNGPDDQLVLTANAQPALLTTSIAAYNLMKDAGITPDVVAGHSLGEYSAIVAAGGMSLEDAAYSVRQRGMLMQKAVPVGEGAMAALIGPDIETVTEICEAASAGEIVTVANINCPGQIVIAGHAGAVDRAIEIAKEKGAKRALKLSVSAPFHSPLMQPAQDGMVAVLDAVTINDLAIPLINNVDVETVTTAEAVKNGLIKQVTGAVRWQETVEKMIELGVDTIVEIGPGKVLSGLVKRVSRQISLYNVEDIVSFENTLKALKG
jgi:[acyl-carrier-protein] S-malonyltransferase